MPQNFTRLLDRIAFCHVEMKSASCIFHFMNQLCTFFCGVQLLDTGFLAYVTHFFYPSAQPNYASVREHCNVWRNYIDIQDSWENVKNVFKFYGENKQNFANFSGPGGFSDPDQVCEKK